ncbi:MAG: hypothetical protein ACRC7V_05975 [Lachnospiraceae bacterium]
MIDIDKIRLMTKMAVYESNEGKKNKHINSYFRSDYIGLELLKSFMFITIGFGIFLFLYVIYDVEFFMNEIYKMSIMEFMKSILAIYLIVIVFFSIITYFISLYNYRKSRQEIKNFYSHLNKISTFYEDR